MRRFLLTVLAALGVAAALTVTASSTTIQAHAAGMVGLPVAGLVVLLEVVNVVGSWAWITDPRSHVRVESAVGVLVASAVTGICGALTYGPLGLVAPLGLLAAVHGVSRMWGLPIQPAQEQQAQPEAPARVEPPTEVLPVQPEAPAQPPALPCDSVGEPVEPADLPAPPESDDELLPRLRAWVRQDGRMPGRDAVKREFGIGTNRAERLREQAQRPDLTAVKEA